MNDFISSILTATDFQELLGDLYQPTVACIVASYAILSFGALCSSLTLVIRSIFSFRVR